MADTATLKRITALTKRIEKAKDDTSDLIAERARLAAELRDDGMSLAEVCRAAGIKHSTMLTQIDKHAAV